MSSIKGAIIPYNIDIKVVERGNRPKAIEQSIDNARYQNTHETIEAAEQ
jgi:hypothetical protein